MKTNINDGLKACVSCYWSTHENGGSFSNSLFNLELVFMNKNVIHPNKNILLIIVININELPKR